MNLLQKLKSLFQNNIPSPTNRAPKEVYITLYDNPTYRRIHHDLASAEREEKSFTGIGKGHAKYVLVELSEKD